MIKVNSRVHLSKMDDGTEPAKAKRKRKEIMLMRQHPAKLRKTAEGSN
jgi:hypothetical protein